MAKGIIKDNWYGFDIAVALEKLEADEYLGSFCIRKGDRSPRALFYSKNPNRDLGHKSYPMLHVAENDTIYVSAMDLEQIKHHRWHPAIHCKICDWVIYSHHVHDFRPCMCEKDENIVHIDGGKDYYAPRIVSGKSAKFEVCDIDILTGRIRIGGKGRGLKVESV